MLDLVRFRILGLFGLMFDLFWDHFGFPGPDSIFGNLVFLGFHVGDVQTVTSGSIFGDF